MPRTWRDSWELDWSGNSCPKCAQGRSTEDEWGLRWYEDDFADGYLLKQPAVLGYSVVVFRGRHVPDPALFTDEEVFGYWSAVREVGSAIYRVYKPAQINYQSLNNEVPHVHTHVVPRYVDDPAPGRPLPPEVFDSARTLERHHLESQVAQLRNALTN